MLDSNSTSNVQNSYSLNAYGKYGQAPLNNQCSTCQHQEICRLRDDYKKVFESALKLDCAPFEMALKCPHYMSMCMNSRTFIYGDTNSCCTLATSESVANG